MPTSETNSATHELLPPEINRFKAMPIPIEELPSVAGWKELPIESIDEPLVPLGINSNYAVYTDSVYAGERSSSPYDGGLDGSLATIFVRSTIADSVSLVESRLPSGLHIVVLDAYRPLEVQTSLFHTYINELRRLKPDWSEDQLETETQKYVSKPSDDPTKPSPHNTGGSIDLALLSVPQAIEEQIRKLDEQIEALGDEDSTDLQIQRYNLISQNGVMLNFGTNFDNGGPEVGLNYLERQAKERQLTGGEVEALENRRLLYHLMTDIARLQPYEDEWWHYNSPHSQMGAKTAGLSKAEYGPAQLSEKDLFFEAHRKKLVDRLDRNTSLGQSDTIKPTE
ncbi:MAG TPA: hypothetical protein VMR34_05030 [Candidatus Saccharimonadales bacterium]|nr:hypothetical protein [Candidatus Saccharimonadales bacterium]